MDTQRGLNRRQAGLGIFSVLAMGCKPERPHESGLSSDSTPQAESTTGLSDAFHVGINLAAVSDHSTELVFADLFKQARPWSSQAPGVEWGGGPPLDLDHHGWVASLRLNQFASTALFTKGGHHAGEYRCLYDGEGTLEFSGNATAIEAEAGRIRLSLSEEPAMFLHLRKTNPINPLRNIRIVSVADETSLDSQPYRKEFLTRCRRFTTLRFMDWMRVNGSLQQSWRQRPKADHATHSADSGVALEVMVSLCNATGCAPWFCMPHLADDSYVRRFAELVRDTLTIPNQIYVEYSNEVWNSQFSQSRFAREKGMMNQLSSDPFHAQLLYYVERSLQVFGIWRTVFGDSTQLKFVVGSQLANPWVTRQLVAHADLAEIATSLSVAPYFGTGLGSTATPRWPRTVEQVLEACNHDLKKISVHLQETSDIVRRAGLEMIAYEGGQHLVPSDQSGLVDEQTAVYTSANRHREMGAIYNELIEVWRGAGGGLFVFYNSMAAPSQHGCWGLLESENQPIDTAPKYQAVISGSKSRIE